MNNDFRIYNGFKSVDELGKNNLDHIDSVILTQSQVLSNPDYSFIINSNEVVLDCLKNSKVTIGSISECVTGFYSGDDKTHLKVMSHNIKNGKRYGIVDNEKVDYDCSTEDLNGLIGDKLYVPIVKGGNTKYWKPDVWFMSWSVKNVSHYKKEKKHVIRTLSAILKMALGFR